ncbi:MAG: GH3 auxin-responsive promoter family protein [Candidatus Thorarchaeota archaeon]|nr:GH3 auxin-responsive promoter family protein [Candidatus Thorarchaeota archaeon]MCK5238310.1 GH3 auxin-responsive promoter family protein [Candidatus Thorarchaeota archaeon]
MSIMRRLIGVVVKKRMKLIKEIMDNPIEMADSTLMSCLEANKDTVIGRQFGFDTITSPDEYRERVPLMDSTKQKKYWEQIYENPKGKILTADDVIWYVESSGTTGKPKRLPLTKTGLKMVSKGSMLGFMAFMAQDKENTKLVEGDMVTLGAPAVMDHINGIPVGYATGVYSEHQNPIFARLMKPGADVYNISDMDEKMWEYAKFLVENNPTAIMGISTLNMTLLRRVNEQYGPALLEEYMGTKYEAKVRDNLSDDGTLDVAGLCPNIKLFVATGMNTDPYKKWIKNMLPNATIWEMYGGSEGFYGTQLTSEPDIYLTPHVTYYEFIPLDEVDSEHPTVIPLSEVKVGERYEMVITNLQGYYRYRLDDLVTFTSVEPYTICNIARKGRVVNLSGEKLSEAHVQNAMAHATQVTGTEITDYSVVGETDELAGRGHYTIAALVNGVIDSEAFVNAFEEHIRGVNEEFRIVRDMDSLGPTRLRVLKQSPVEIRAAEYHIQSKPVTLTTDLSVLQLCEAEAVA